MSKFEEYMNKLGAGIPEQYKQVDATTKLRELEYELQKYDASSKENTTEMLVVDAAEIIIKINSIIKDINAIGDFKNDIKRLKEKYGYGK